MKKCSRDKCIAVTLLNMNTMDMYRTELKNLHFDCISIYRYKSLHIDMRERNYGIRHTCIVCTMYDENA